MQNPIQILRQSSIVFEKSGFCFWRFENFDELQLSYSSIFFTKISHTFPAYQRLQKSVQGFFILFRSWVFCKKLKRPGFYILVFYIFINNSRYKQNKKKPQTPFCIHFYVESTWNILAKNIKLYGSWNSSKFSFCRQKASFLGNNRPLP